MLRLLKRILVLAALCGALWFAADFYAAWRLHAALRESGLSERVSDCMARRLTRKLSLIELMKLQKLEGDKPTLGAWVRAVRAVGDDRVVMVTASSAALCKAGLAR
ncbi:hypothetical protein MTR62_00565 [Novosphingobium sp. 1949]|uniref:Uncharacterized protein n=1 Tax=Novosphingobium organovorum TaxID=2930092 RepID=A0ABT0B892_9SPHN|nr:hypothetical protein [Novosphingobium organovorum]MCJ2181208.1 hypothetical protein [Novosphingobium organovorum]